VSDSKGVASIDIAQVSILLARIDKEKDAVKRESLSKELVEVSTSICAYFLLSLHSDTYMPFTVGD
jgi:hypothetical protein